LLNQNGNGVVVKERKSSLILKGAGDEHKIKKGICMINTRGPDKIFVLDRLAIPVFDVCSSFIGADSISEILLKFPLSKDEVKECMVFFQDNCGPHEHDFIELHCTRNGSDLSVETVGLSDWVYVSAVLRGILANPSEEEIVELYSNGLQLYMHDALDAIINDIPQPSPLSEMVLQAFMESYGPVDPMDAAMLLQTLQDDMQDKKS
jgi:hypothetical protein